jgi:hypothetical protein
MDAGHKSLISMTHRHRLRRDIKYPDTPQKNCGDVEMTKPASFERPRKGIADRKSKTWLSVSLKSPALAPSDVATRSTRISPLWTH